MNHFNFFSIFKMRRHFPHTEIVGIILARKVPGKGVFFTLHYSKIDNNLCE